MSSNPVDFTPFGAARTQENEQMREQSQQFSAHCGEHHQLRLLELSDAPALFERVDADRAYLKQWLSWLDTTQTVEDTRHFIRLTRDRAQEGQGFAAAILYHQSLVGVVGLNSINWSDRSSSLGYWISASMQGKGLVTLSCQSVLNYAFNTLNLNRIAILCATQNVRSAAIPRRLGFTYEGRLRQAQWIYDHFVDHDVFSMLRHEWPKDSH